jgi:hypothetical protein
VVTGAALAAIVAGLAVGGTGDTNKKTFEYAVGLWGDLPYSQIQADQGVPNLIADKNNGDLQFTVNDGDLKAGDGTTGNPPSANCTNELYAQALAWLNSLEKPAMFTPGDNDWTDCDRPSNGGYNSLERLDYERQLFFSTPSSLGKHTLEQEVQSDPTKCLGYVSGPAVSALRTETKTLRKPSPSSTSTETPTTSVSTSRCSTRTACGSRTSPASRPSATTPLTGSATCTG